MAGQRERLPGEAFIQKAIENVDDAQAALDAGRYNASARSSYYAAFHAAVAALWAAGIRPRHESEGMLSHKMVQAEWAGRLISRRKLYPADLRGTQGELMALRLQADYRPDHVTARQARRSVAASERLVRVVAARLRPTTEQESSSNGATG